MEICTSNLLCPLFFTLLQQQYCGITESEGQEEPSEAIYYNDFHLLKSTTPFWVMQQLCE